MSVAVAIVTVRRGLAGPTVQLTASEMARGPVLPRGTEP